MPPGEEDTPPETIAVHPKVNLGMVSSNRYAVILYYPFRYYKICMPPREMVHYINDREGTGSKHFEFYLICSLSHSNGMFSGSSV